MFQDLDPTAFQAAVAAGQVLSPQPGEYLVSLHKYDFSLRLANLSDGDPLFSTAENHLRTTEISAVVKECERHHDVEPVRIVPVCMRKNVITQMEYSSTIASVTRGLEV